jgi:hypothetical protein
MANKSSVEVTRVDNFVCPACGEVIRQVAARDGVVKGWCPHAKKEINVVVAEIKTEMPVAAEPIVLKPLTHLDELKAARAKTLKDVVSAREDGDLKENSAYHAAREQLSILDDKILHEEDKIKKGKRNN